MNSIGIEIGPELLRTVENAIDRRIEKLGMGPMDEDLYFDGFLLVQWCTLKRRVTNWVPKFSWVSKFSLTVILFLKE